MNHRAYQDLEQKRAAANRLLVAGQLTGAAARAQVLDDYRRQPDAAARLIDPIDAEPTFALSETATDREIARADTLGGYITSLRLAKGWYAEDLARAAHIERRDLDEFESNRSCPARARLNRLAEVLDADPERMTALAAALRRQLYAPATATPDETPAPAGPAEEEPMLIAEMPAAPAAPVEMPASAAEPDPVPVDTTGAITPPASLGAYLRQLREAKGLTPWHACKAAGHLATNDLSLMEADKRVPREGTVRRLIAALGGDMDLALSLLPASRRSTSTPASMTWRVIDADEAGEPATAPCAPNRTADVLPVQHLPRVAWQQDAYRIVQVREARDEAAPREQREPCDPYVLETTDGTDAMGTPRWVAVSPASADEGYVWDVLGDLVRVLGGGR